MKARTFKDNLILYLFLSPVLIYITLFCYVPIYGVIIAFQNYTVGNDFLSIGHNTVWVGLKHFKDFLTSVFFYRLIENTLILNGLYLVVGFCASIIFALLLNEIRVTRLKKLIQTTSYLPYFISMVVVASMVLTLTSQYGMINQIASALSLPSVDMNTNGNTYPWIYMVTLTWKSFGWNSIIYVASITGIDPTLYESARIDGANRFKQMLHITLPSISSTIFILLIFTLGGLLNANSEFVLLTYNPAIYSNSDVIGTYIFRVGLQGGQFSKTTAIGLYMQIINFVLLYIANTVARRVAQFSIW